MQLILLAIGTLCLLPFHAVTQEICHKQFYCDSLIRVYYGPSPELATTIYQYALGSHYSDSEGTRYLYREINGSPDLEWKMKRNGDIIYGSEENVRFKLCTEPDSIWLYQEFTNESLLMLSEGVIMYPVFGDLKPCISFVELSVFDAENDGKIDTVATYRYILHDSLGIVAKMSVDHGTAFTMQGVQCVHGFFGSPAVGLLEHDLSADRRIISMGNTLRIQTDDWGDGVMRLYFYDGTLHSVTDITPYNDQIVVEVESDYTRILFWSYTTKSGRLYRGSVVTH